MKNLVLIVLAALALNSLAQPGTKNFIDQNYIEVTGKAEMEVVPNEIYLAITVDEKDFKGKQEIQGIEKSMFKQLAAMGINVQEQLAVKDMASNFKKYWLKGQEINTVREYQLKVANANTAGRAIRELESLGVSNISIEKIGHSEIQRFRTEVKINAIKAAKEKAASLTNAIGQDIGKAIYIQELDNRFAPFQAKAAGLSNIVVRGYGDTDGLEAGQPEIEFEKIKLEYSILARFEVE